MVLKKNGSVLATGWNEHGQLGDGTKTDRNKFVEMVLPGRWGWARVRVKFRARAMWNHTQRSKVGDG